MLFGFASKTFSFEADLEDWAVAQGTFNRSSALGGVGGTNWAVESSTSLDNQCDRIRSPLMRMQSTSTHSLETNYDIDGVTAGGQHHDRHSRLGADGPAHLESIAFGQHHVEDHELRLVVAEAQQRLVTVGGCFDREPRIHESEFGDFPNGGIVLDEKNRCVHIPEYG